MAKGDWWFRFEIAAWRNSPELRRCSLETRGFWIDCIAIMRDTETAMISGTFEDFARIVGCFPNEAERCINELKRNKTADVTQKNENVTLKSRKYERELKAKKQTRLRVQKFRSNADVTQKKRDRVISKSKEKEIREDNSKELSKEGEAQAPARQQGKATRISDLWNPTAELFAWGATEYPKIDLLTETLKFKNYYGSAPDAKALKTDWAKAWKNWIIKAQEFLAKENGNGNGSRIQHGRSGNSNGASAKTDNETLAGLGITSN